MASEVEKLAGYGKVWDDIGKAVKIALLIAKKNTDMQAIIQETKKHADELEKLQIKEDDSPEDLKQPLKELNKVAQETLKQCIKLETGIVNIIRDAEEFEKLVKEKIKNSVIPSEFLDDFCKELENLCQGAQGFSQEFVTLTDLQGKVKEQAVKLAELMKAKIDEFNANTTAADVAAVADKVKILGLVVGLAGFIALDFFTGKAASAAAGFVIAGGVCTVGGHAVAAVARKIDFDGPKKLRDLADGLQADAGKLNAIAVELRKLNERTGEFKLDPEAAKALWDALAYFKREMEKEEETNQLRNNLAQSQAQNSEKDAVIARLRAELSEKAQSEAAGNQ